jgi:hypothetical protein
MKDFKTRHTRFEVIVPIPEAKVVFDNILASKVKEVITVMQDLEAAYERFVASFLDA